MSTSPSRGKSSLPESDEEVQISRLFSLYQSLDGKLEEQKTVQHQLEKSLGLQGGLA